MTFFKFIPFFATIAVVHSNVGFIHFNQPIPSFLQSMSLKAQYDYKVILENETIAVDLKNTGFEKWAETYKVTVSFDILTLEKEAGLTFFVGK